jgi:hypothetical protein
MPPCTRCAKSHSTPHAFLLSCSGNCAKSWHHRALLILFTVKPKALSITGCHQPPVTDQELVARIKAFNDGDIENSIHAWLCRRCSKINRVDHPNVQPSVTVDIPTKSIPSLCVKYNLAPSWMHNRHLDIGKTPQNRTRRKVIAKYSLPRDSFSFSCISWLQERRGS